MTLAMVGVMTPRALSILTSRDTTVTIRSAAGGYGATAAVVGAHGDRIKVRVTHANPGASIHIGDVLAVPVDRIGLWTSR